MSKQPTTQEEAFLQDIIEHPDDDAPRLIYADWLDDQGKETERAEFIRIQCRLAQMATKDPQAKALRKREQTLLKKNRQTWMEGVPKWAQRGSEFRRGFFAKMNCTVEDFLRGGYRLVARVSLEEILFRRGKASTVEHLANFSHIRRIRSLTFNAEVELTSKNSDALVQSPYLGELRSLDLCLGTGVCFANVVTSPHLAKLSRLICHGGSLAPRYLRRCVESDHLVTLEVLNMHSTKLKSRALQAWSETSFLTSVRDLQLTHAEIEAVGICALVESSASPRLERLRLGRNPICDRGVEALAKWVSLSNLRSLALYKCHFGDRGAQALAAAPQLSQLTSLDLGLNRITDEGANALLDSPYLQNVTDLTLWRNQLSQPLRKQLRKKFGKPF